MIFIRCTVGCDGDKVTPGDKCHVTTGATAVYDHTGRLVFVTTDNADWTQEQVLLDSYGRGMLTVVGQFCPKHKKVVEGE